VDKNLLFYGDNLEVLRRDIPNESVDLVYLDPPFNSNRSYNVLFASKSGDESQAQIEAFDDTWTWSHEAEAAYDEMVQGGTVPPKVADAVEALRRLLGDNDVLAYLVMMTARLVELHRVLKPTGSLYLHCDPTASHYLKLILDAIFGPQRFRNEFIWKRSTAHSDTKQGSRQAGRLHDVIFFYAKGEQWTWNPIYTPYDEEYVESKYRHIEEGTGRRFRKDNLTAAKPGGDTSYEFRGVKPYKGRYWAYSKEKMEQFAAEGRLYYTRTGMPEYKRYLDEMPGVPLQDLWTDIAPINAKASERLGYPTQKPEALLERIITASSNEGDIVLDPFCGCGTTVAVAQRMRRNWIGIDITFLAVDLISKRLIDTHGEEVAETFETRGIPRDLAGAKALFRQDPFDFERWAVSLVDAQPNLRQVGDKGADGVIRFPLDGSKAIGRALVSVKGGESLNPGMVRDLVGTVSSQRAELGLFISLEKPTRGMVDAAQHAGTFVWPFNGKTYPKVQLITVAELLDGKSPDLPPAYLPYVQAKRMAVGEQQSLL
jgi:DNA modification methylase